MTPPAQPNDADEFRVTRWQLQQIAKYSDLERIVWAVLNKPAESRPAPVAPDIAKQIKEIRELAQFTKQAWDEHDATIRNETLTMVIKETIESCHSEEPYVPNMIECGDCPFFILYDEGIDCVMKSLRSPKNSSEFEEARAKPDSTTAKEERR